MKDVVENRSFVLYNRNLFFLNCSNCYGIFYEVGFFFFGIMKTIIVRFYFICIVVSVRNRGEGSDFKMKGKIIF